MSIVFICSFFRWRLNMSNVHRLWSNSYVVCELWKFVFISRCVSLSFLLVPGATPWYFQPDRIKSPPELQQNQRKSEPRKNMFSASKTFQRWSLGGIYNKDIFGSLLLWCWRVKQNDLKIRGHTHTLTHSLTHTHIYIYIYMCVCVCVCWVVQKIKREYRFGFRRMVSCQVLTVQTCTDIDIWRSVFRKKYIGC